jgi:hypothetical protein
MKILLGDFSAKVGSENIFKQTIGDDPVPDALLLRASGSAMNRPHTSRSVARNSDH